VEEQDAGVLAQKAVGLKPATLQTQMYQVTELFKLFNIPAFLVDIKFVSWFALFDVVVLSCRVGDFSSCQQEGEVLVAFLKICCWIVG
jgi:hypothetical protein